MAGTHDYAFLHVAHASLPHRADHDVVDAPRVAVATRMVVLWDHRVLLIA